MIERNLRGKGEGFIDWDGSILTLESNESFFSEYDPECEDPGRSTYVAAVVKDQGTEYVFKYEEKYRYGLFAEINKDGGQKTSLLKSFLTG